MEFVGNLSTKETSLSAQTGKRDEAILKYSFSHEFLTMPFVHIDRLQALLGLLREGAIDGMEFYRRVARIGADAVRSSRAGVWLFRDEIDGCSITCMGMYDRVRGRNTNVPDVHSSQAGLFFDALTRIGHVVADDAVSHPATRLFFERKITQLNVRSLAATAFSVNGKLYGAFTCTQVDAPRHWTQKEIILLKRLDANASLVLSEADRWLQSQKDDHGCLSASAHKGVKI